MKYSSLFSVLFSSVCIISLICGIYVLEKNRKARINRCYFALMISLIIWSAGLAIATSSTDIKECEFWRHFSAVGWGTFYAIDLHFILALTGNNGCFKKKTNLIILYLPAVITLLTFAFPVGINKTPYQLYQTQFGWANVSANNFWDILFYLYYIIYSITVLALVLRWGKKSSDITVKKQSRIIFISFIITFVASSVTDVLITITGITLPQMAPIIMLIPIAAIFYIINKYGFIVSERVDYKGKYLMIINLVIIYLFLSYIMANAGQIAGYLNIEVSTLRGLTTQFHLIISILLVLKENRPGHLAAASLNIINLITSLAHAILNSSTSSIPGIMSSLCTLLIIWLIVGFRKKTALQIREIEIQSESLEDSERKLYRLAFYDSLTELPNRNLFTERLKAALDEAEKSSSPIGIIFIDISFFKTFNDTMGHATGDMVLKKVAERLTSCLKKDDIVSRFGGDEFTILVKNINCKEDIDVIAYKIIELFKHDSITVNNSEFFVSVNIGASIYPADGTDPETLITHADIAKQKAKRKGNLQCVYFSSDMKSDIGNNLTLQNALYRSLERRELYLHYQPQVKSSTREIIGFEALLRWKSTEHGSIPPNVFIPIAEQTGLIRPIGLWVIEAVCRQCNECEKCLNSDIRISVNLSIDQLKDEDIAVKIREILDSTGTDPRKLQFEITESVAFNEEHNILQRIKELKNLGASIAIDDFGTGYSSFSRLKAFPIDLIKIDMEFVRGISSNSEKDKAIIKSIIQIAKNLGISVLAEGVETEEQYIFLKETGCDEIQGYYFYKPMPAEEAHLLLKESDPEAINL